MLIILYGPISDKPNEKHQLLIDGKATCGYREYAKNYGHIIYMTPQQTMFSWEHSMKPDEVIEFIKQYPDAIVWALKYSPTRDDKILANIQNKKIYYSCNSKNTINSFCNVSLVDTQDRIKQNAQLWFKGKDPSYWLPSDKKEFDYLMIGRRGDKNELPFIYALDKEVQNRRRVLWIGGERFKKHISKDNKHDIVCTDFIGQEEVRRLIPKAKVGVLFTELEVEGFPQSFLEMTMCGVPVVYNKNAPLNKYYMHSANCVLCRKKELVVTAEMLLSTRDAVKCRDIAMQNYSLELSYRRIKECLE
jgi:hypothetical protein